MGKEGTSNNYQKPTANASKSKVGVFTPLLTPVTSERGSCRRTDSEITLNRIRHSAKSSDCSDVGPSSSSNSLSDDFMQDDPQLFSKSNAANKIAKPNGGIKQSYHIDVASEFCFRFEESVELYPGSLTPHLSPTLFPPLQMMERPEGFDPSRIPNSIFSKPVSPRDWSEASNESLFSIHIGNNSFSRDPGFRIGVDSYRSGELPKSGELHQSGELPESGELHLSEELSESGELHLSEELSESGELHQSGEPYMREELQPSVELHQSMKPSKELTKFGDPEKSDEINGFKQIMPTSQGAKPQILHNSMDVNEDMKPKSRETKDKPINDFSSISNQVDSIKISAFDSSKANRLSVISENRSFPREKKPSSCPMCHCSACSWGFFCCKWSSCFCKSPSHCCKWSCRPCKWLRGWHCSCHWLKSCFKWPSWHCKCPSWPSCHCKCSTWSSCCCKFPTWSNFCCKCPAWSSSFCRFSSLPSCCKCSSWHCCKCDFPSCSWTCCRGCNFNFPSCSCMHCLGHKWKKSYCSINIC